MSTIPCSGRLPSGDQSGTRYRSDVEHSTGTLTRIVRRQGEACLVRAPALLRAGQHAFVAGWPGLLGSSDVAIYCRGSGVPKPQLHLSAAPLADGIFPMAPLHSADDAFDRARVVRRIFMLLGEKLVLIIPSALLLVGAPRVVAMLWGDNLAIALGLPAQVYRNRAGAGLRDHRAGHVHLPRPHSSAPCQAWRASRRSYIRLRATISGQQVCEQCVGEPTVLNDGVETFRELRDPAMLDQHPRS